MCETMDGIKVIAVTVLYAGQWSVTSVLLLAKLNDPYRGVFRRVHAVTSFVRCRHWSCHLSLITHCFYCWHFL